MKPENVLLGCWHELDEPLGMGTHVQLADFGLAEEISPGVPHPTAGRCAEDALGDVLGVCTCIADLCIVGVGTTMPAYICPWDALLGAGCKFGSGKNDWSLLGAPEKPLFEHSSCHEAS